jgi:hypothetical protein
VNDVLSKQFHIASFDWILQFLPAFSNQTLSMNKTKSNFLQSTTPCTSHSPSTQESLPLCTGALSGHRSSSPCSFWPRSTQNSPGLWYESWKSNYPFCRLEMIASAFMSHFSTRNKSFENRLLAGLCLGGFICGLPLCARVSRLSIYFSLWFFHYAISFSLSWISS